MRIIPELPHHHLYNLRIAHKLGWEWDDAHRMYRAKEAQNGYRPLVANSDGTPLVDFCYWGPNDTTM